jgi:hypothetical protein
MVENLGLGETTTYSDTMVKIKNQILFWISSKTLKFPILKTKTKISLSPCSLLPGLNITLKRVNSCWKLSLG